MSSSPGFGEILIKEGKKLSCDHVRNNSPVLQTHTTSELIPENSYRKFQQDVSSLGIRAHLRITIQTHS